MAKDENTLWQITYEDEKYDLLAEDLTVGRLRHFKQWFGGQYGQYLTFIQLMIQGDCDAVACALWVVKTKAGEKTPDPRNLDFAVSQFFVQEDDDDEVDEAVGEGQAEEAPSDLPAERTPDSDRTSENSEPSISGS